MKHILVITLLAEDRPGIVESLSRTVAGHQGNWVESSLLALAGQFAGVLMAELPESEVADCLAELDELRETGLNIQVAVASAPVVQPGYKIFDLELIGHDRPGIVRDITHILAKHQVNVEVLNTEVQEASMTGETLFVANARIQVGDSTSLEDLQEELEALANELMVDIKLENE